VHFSIRIKEVIGRSRHIFLNIFCKIGFSKNTVIAIERILVRVVPESSFKIVKRQCYSLARTGTLQRSIVPKLDKVISHIKIDFKIGFHEKNSTRTICAYHLRSHTAKYSAIQRIRDKTSFESRTQTLPSFL